MNENTSGISCALGIYGPDAKGLRMVGCEELRRNEPGSHRSTAPVDRGDELREIAANLERLCIEYDCYGRVSPQGSERRATWAQFKAQIEALREMA